MSAQDEYQDFLDTDSEHSGPLIVKVPSSLPELSRRRRLGLSHSRYGVGVESEAYVSEATGAVWQSWVVLGSTLALCLGGGLVMLLEGDWVLVLAVAPLAGLSLVGMVRSLRVEQKAARAKQVRIAKRKRAMRE